MLNLLDILAIKNLSLGTFKIHLATGKNPTPFEAFLDGTFKEWQAQQNAKNFECDTIISLIALDVDQWLFAGVYNVLGGAQGTESPYYYQTELLPGLDDLIGRSLFAITVRPVPHTFGAISTHNSLRCLRYDKSAYLSNASLALITL